MFADRIEAHWIAAFEAQFRASAIGPESNVIVLSETQSRAVNVELAELALARIGCVFFHLKVPTPAAPPGPILRSTGAARALTGQAGAVVALSRAEVVVDLTLEGLMHAPELKAILTGGARVLTVSNEHPEILGRMPPDEELKAACLAAARACRSAREMRVTSPAGRPC